MSDDERKFDELFARLLHNGKMDGRYLLESFDPVDRKAMALILERLQEFSGSLGHGWKGWTRPFRVHTNYINEGSANAFAVQYDADEQLYFVGITAGIALKGFGLWSTICACTKAGGNADGELQPPPRIDIFKAFRARDMTEPWHILPKQRERMALAHCMHLVALEWLFFHEIGHIVHGHAGRLWQRDGPLQVLKEFQVKPLQLISFEDHLMEVDADDVATWWCLDNWVRGRAPLLAGSPFRLELDDYAQLLFFSICILQHAFGTMRTKVEEVPLGPGSTHPHGEVRVDVAFNAIHKYYEHGGLIENYNEENLSNRLWTAIEEARDAIILLAPEHTPFPNLFRADKQGKPIKEVTKLYMERLAADTRAAWRPFRLNVEPA